MKLYLCKQSMNFGPQELIQRYKMELIGWSKSNPDFQFLRE